MPLQILFLTGSARLCIYFFQRMDDDVALTPGEGRGDVRHAGIRPYRKIFALGRLLLCSLRRAA